MFANFTLLVFTGGAIRFGANHILYRRFGVVLSAPQFLAGVLVLVSAMPDFLQPFRFPLPTGLTLGLFLPDLLLARQR